MRRDLLLSQDTASGPSSSRAKEYVDSAQQDMLGAALEASKLSLNRLIAVRNEVEKAIERGVIGTCLLASVRVCNGPVTPPLRPVQGEAAGREAHVRGGQGSQGRGVLQERQEHAR